jgi:hypothetical protein
MGLIEERLGVRAAHFAYPKAVPGSPAADTAVRRRFVSAAVGGNRANPYGNTDPFRLARSSIQLSDGMRWFKRKVDGGMALEDSFRRLLNRRRYAGATRLADSDPRQWARPGGNPPGGAREGLPCRGPAWLRALQEPARCSLVGPAACVGAPCVGVCALRAQGGIEGPPGEKAGGTWRDVMEVRHRGDDGSPLPL